MWWQGVALGAAAAEAWGPCLLGLWGLQGVQGMQGMQGLQGVQGVQGWGRQELRLMRMLTVSLVGYAQPGGICKPRHRGEGPIGVDATRGAAPIELVEFIYCFLHHTTLDHALLCPTCPAGPAHPARPACPEADTLALTVPRSEPQTNPSRPMPRDVRELPPHTHNPPRDTSNIFVPLYLKILKLLSICTWIASCSSRGGMQREG